LQSYNVSNGKKPDLNIEVNLSSDWWMYDQILCCQMEQCSVV